MNAMLVSPDHLHYDHLQAIFNQIEVKDVHIFHYVQALKALDNLTEIEPEAIFWDAESFPRHWKLLLPLYNHDKKFKLILFTSQQLEAQEIKKAKALELAGIIQNGILHPESASLIRHLILGHNGERRQQAAETKVIELSDLPSALKENEQLIMQKGVHQSQEYGNAILTMTHPLSLKLIYGKILFLNSDNVFFKSEQIISIVPKDTIFRNCNMQIGDNYLTLDMKLQREGDGYILYIQKNLEEYQAILKQFAGKVIS